MAIMDEYLEFCDATALNTGGAGTYLLGDVVDLGAVTRDIGEGEALYFIVTVDTAATSGGSATARFILASDAQAAIATDGTATVHIDSGAIPVATLAAGYIALRAPIPASGAVYERYLGVLQTTATAAFTAGKINAFIGKDFGKYRSYADASAP